LIPAIVLGCDSNGYGVIRSIAKFDRNIHIIGVDSNTNSPGLFSKYLVKKIIITDPNADEEKTYKELIAISEQFNTRPIVIITSDIFLSLFNKFRKDLSNFFLFNIPSKELLDKILDKGRQYNLVKGLGVDLPNTIFLSKEDKLTDTFELNFPVFVKGAFPHIWKQFYTEKGFVADNFEKMEIIVNTIKKKNLDLIIQELIVGPNCNHYKVSTLFNCKREPKLFFTTQKARQFPFDFGVGSYMRSERVEELLEIGKKIFDALGYTGIGSIEFKKDERDGKYKFIELNPRMWQQNYQATLAGLNFAEYYYRDLAGDVLEFNDDFLENVTYIDTVNDFQSFYSNKKITEESFYEWVKQVLKADSYAFFEKKDLTPILKSSKYGTKVFKYLFKSGKLLSNVE